MRFNGFSKYKRDFKEKKRYPIKQTKYFKELGISKAPIMTQTTNNVRIFTFNQTFNIDFKINYTNKGQVKTETLH